MTARRVGTSLHRRAFGRWIVRSTCNVGGVEDQGQIVLQVGSCDLAWPDATSGEFITSVGIVLAIERIRAGTIHRGSEWLGNSVGSCHSGSNTTPQKFSLDSNSNRCGDCVWFSFRVWDWLSHSKWNRARFIAVTIVPFTLRSRPRSSTCFLHAKFLLRVNLTVSNLRISWSWELEALIGCRVLKDVNIVRVHFCEPLLVRSTSAGVSGHSSIATIFLSLKTPTSLTVDDPSILIVWPDLSSGSGASFVVNKERCWLRHIVTSIHLDALMVILVDHSSTSNHRTIVLNINFGLRAAAWAHIERSTSRVVWGSIHTLTIRVFKRIKILFNSVCGPGSLIFERPLHSVRSCAEPELNFATINVEASVLINITESTIGAVLVVLVTGTVAVLSMEGTITWVFAGSLNTSTPLMLVSSQFTRSDDIRAEA